MSRRDMSESIPWNFHTSKFKAFFLKKKYFFVYQIKVTEAVTSPENAATISAVDVDSEVNLIASNYVSSKLFILGLWLGMLEPFDVH